MLYIYIYFFAYTLMADLAPQVAKLIEAGQEQ